MLRKQGLIGLLIIGLSACASTPSTFKLTTKETIQEAWRMESVESCHQKGYLKQEQAVEFFSIFFPVLQTVDYDKELLRLSTNDH